MNKIMIDTGIFIALFSKHDIYHKKSIDFVKSENMLTYTTDAVITEVEYIFYNRVDIQYDFLKLISKSNINIVTFANEDYIKLAELMKKYCDLPMDFADATVVYGCEKINSNVIATVDSDFNIYKYKGTKSFKNIIDL